MLAGAHSRSSGLRRGNSEFQMEIFDREKKRGFCMSAMPALVQYDHAADAYVASYISRWTELGNLLHAHVPVCFVQSFGTGGFS